MIIDPIVQKLEEKIMLLLQEINRLREELQQAQQKNENLMFEQTQQSKKIQELFSLLDSLNMTPVHAKSSDSVLI
ncbi:MAG: hypothetical protein ACD_60C00041G0013 [uncultured bacterium]|nr:MAG: hypothetical protein ACD_60C00041G0013 [uncultured bacterium]